MFKINENTNFYSSLFKAMTDEVLNESQIKGFVINTVENIVETGENAIIHHFLLLQQCFNSLPHNDAS